MLSLFRGFFIFIKEKAPYQRELHYLNNFLINLNTSNVVLLYTLL